MKRSREPPAKEAARLYNIYLREQLRFRATVKSGSPPGDSANGADTKPANHCSSWLAPAFLIQSLKIDV
ncbi:MAG TPA: hypothetical protein VE641_09450 [Chthoniobacterales bacterium]|nr:hypothetical protein [Chthoniobacterales bacterium]